MMLNLLNMLIAIMGSTFEKNQEIASLTVYKSRLTFVVDNWWIRDYVLGSRLTSTQYLIAGILNEEDDEETEIIKEVQDEIMRSVEQRKFLTGEINKELKKIKQKMQQNEKNQKKH
jgi:hypothetical protein